MAWLFGDSFDHYTDLITKYDAVGTHQAIGLGNGRFGTNGCQFTGAPGYIKKTVTTATPYAAFITVACSFQRTDPGRFGFLNLWSDTRGHLVVARENDGAISVHRQTGDEAPFDSSGPVLATTAANVWPVGVYCSIQVGTHLDPTNGSLYVSVNGDFLVAQVGLPTANPNASGWTGWYIGMEKSFGTLDIDDLMIYSDLNVGDGVNTFLGDLTAECLVPQAQYSVQWTRGGLSSDQPNWAAVDEMPPDNDSTYVEAGVIGLTDYYQMKRLARVSQGIRSIQVVMTARKTGSPSRNMAAVIIDASQVVYESPPIPLTVAYEAAIVPKPLASYGGYWNMDQVNAIVLGIKLVG